MDPWSEAAIEQNRRWLTAFILSLTGNRNSTEDLVQDVFRTAYEKRDSFEPGTNFGGWLRAIARNIVRRYCERQARLPLFRHEEAFERLEQLAAACGKRSLDPACEDRKRFLLECLGKLSTKIRRLINLRYRDGFSTQRIAGFVGMRVSALNVAVFRARHSLGNCVRRKEREVRVA